MSRRWRNYERRYGQTNFLRREYCDKEGHTWDNQFTFKGFVHRTCCDWRQKGQWTHTKRTGYIFKVYAEGPGWLRDRIK